MISPSPPTIRKPTLRALLGLAWALFGGLAWAVVRTGGPSWDAPILLFWHRHATPALDALAVFFTIVGNTGPMVGLGVLVLLALLRRRAWHSAVVWTLSVGGSMLLTQVIKALVARPRPTLWLSLRPETTLSFPSGHAMDTAAIATALIFLLWHSRFRAWAVVLGPLFALAVGWARMYLGVHNPSDVLAGWAAAVGWVLLVQLVAGRRGRMTYIGRMKSFAALTLLVALAACSKDAPEAPPVPATSVVYTDGAGKTTTLSTFQASLSTPPPSTSGQARRILVLKSNLPDGTTLELLYYYVGSTFPTSTGPVQLDEFVQSANYPIGGNANGGPFFGGSSTGTLTVDSVTPALCSGTFAGPMVVGGPRVRLAFQRVPL
ncbi:phosphatase PAP2 family protein [Hymenobacter sp. M29]|uniref:Phosphatase PAP2 family protein n=1 Tax=Hymenobacter mellowenesis TaxID=3063995 RepID=A0ABT9AIM5_9BACT|nr:phosphatase PAP2 family protein [Hymenobacter sp. M29]MDO7849423.1 phosphatase PAP2 family protein [Hymenobacter sp. M29]